MTLLANVPSKVIPYAGKDHEAANSFKQITRILEEMQFLIASAINILPLSYTPTIIGLTTPGLGTYTQQQGIYAIVGPFTYASVQVAWTAHTGTGQMSLVLPTTVRSSGATPPAPTFQIGFISASGWTWAAGVTDIQALVFAGSTRCDVYTNTSGSLAAQAIVASGVLRASVLYF